MFRARVTHSFIHSFIHSLAISRIVCRSFMHMRYRQLRVKDLPKVPTWRLERDSNSRPFGRKAPNLPMSPTLHMYIVLQCIVFYYFYVCRLHFIFLLLLVFIPYSSRFHFYHSSQPFHRYFPFILLSSSYFIKSNCRSNRVELSPTKPLVAVSWKVSINDGIGGSRDLSRPASLPYRLHGPDIRSTRRQRPIYGALSHRTLFPVT